MGKSLADFIGEFLEYDPKNNSHFLRLFMRIRVLVDVRKPLKRMKKIKKPGGDAKEVKFKYERLNSFCYFYGLLGHNDDHCLKLFQCPRDDGSRGWGPYLRAEIRKSPGSGGSRWLREEGQSSWVAPSMGPLRLAFNGINSKYVTDINVAKDTGFGEVQEGKVGMVDMFRNPELFIPKIAHDLPVMHDNNEVHNDDEMIVEDSEGGGKKHSRNNECLYGVINVKIMESNNASPSLHVRNFVVKTTNNTIPTLFQQASVSGCPNNVNEHFYRQSLASRPAGSHEYH